MVHCSREGKHAYRTYRQLAIQHPPSGYKEWTGSKATLENSNVHPPSDPLPPASCSSPPNTVHPARDMSLWSDISPSNSILLNNSRPTQLLAFIFHLGDCFLVAVDGWLALRQSHIGAPIDIELTM